MQLPPKRALILAVAAVGAVAGAALLAPALFTGARLPAALGAMAPLLLAAVGMTLLLPRGQVDLAVGQQVAVGAAVATTLAAKGVPLAVIVPAALLAGAAIGAIDGAVVTLLRLPAVLATFALSIVWGQGLRWYLADAPARPLPPARPWLGLPPAAGATLFVAVGLIALVAVAGRGRRLRSSGVAPFALVGALAALGGVLAALEPPVAATDAGLMLVRVLAAALLAGGSGGAGGAVATAAAVIVVGAVGSALPLATGLAPWARAVEGTLLLVALATDGIVRRVRRQPPLLDAGGAQELPPPGPGYARLAGLAILIGAELAVVGLGPGFVSPGNLAELLRVASEVALIALPASLLLAAGRTDLSPPGITAVATVALVLALRPPALPFSASIALVLAVGAAAGGGNALLVRGLRLPSGLATLAFALVLRGVAEALLARLKGPPAPLPPPLGPLVTHLMFGIVPRPLMVVVVVALGFHFAGELAARRRQRREGLLFVLGGLLAAATGVLLVAHRAVGRPELGASFALFALTAAVLAGAGSPAGPSVAGALLGSLAVAVLVNGLPLAQVSAPMVDVATALLLLGALAASGPKQSLSLPRPGG